jgi:hypothetical protein
VIGSQILVDASFIPEPKSRNSATSNASTFIIASVILPSVIKHFDSSTHIDAVGHENRASIQRTALGRGEHAYTKPAPVALLIHVCEEAHEIPFPQFCALGLGRIAGRAVISPIL